MPKFKTGDRVSVEGFECDGTVKFVGEQQETGKPRIGVALDEPPVGWTLVNPVDAKGAMASLLSGTGATVVGEAPWLADLPKGDGLRISIGTERHGDLGEDHLQFAPQVLTLGVIGLLAMTPLACQPTLAEWAPDNNTHVVSLACWQYICLNSAREQGVGRLFCMKPGMTAPV